jgi:hypothetical protein
MPLMELNIEGLWAAKQSGQGTPATAPTTATTGKRYRKVAGDIGTTPEDGSENYSDGQRLSSAAQFRTTLQGGGSPGIQMQPGTVGHLSWLWMGQETPTGTATNAVQTASITGATAGTAKLVFGGQSTAPIVFNATSAAVQAAFESLANVGKGNVTVTGGPWPATAMIITFVGQMRASPHTAITIDSTGLTGGTPSVTQTTVGVAVQHVATPTSSSHWLSMWKQLGSTVSQKQRFNDCRIAGLQLQCGRDQFVGRITPTIISLDPGETITADPTLVEDDDDSILWTEAEGQLNINGVVFSGTTGYNITTSDGLTPAYGDSVKAFDVGSGVGQVTGADIQVYLNAAGLAKYNEIIYGSSTPAAGAKPIARVPAIGSFSVKHWRYNTSASPGRQVFIECPNVQWTSPDAPAGNPDGGLASISLGFRTVKRGSDPHIRITTNSADAGYTL